MTVAAICEAINVFSTLGNYCSKQASNLSLELKQKDESPTKGFQLSQPDNEPPFESMCQKAAVPGSSSSLDELCGHRKTEKEQKSSKLSKLLRNKGEDKSNDAASRSSENVVNNNHDTVQEDDVDINICPIDDAVDAEQEEEEEEEEAGIDIYPLDQEPLPGCSSSVEHGEGVDDVWVKKASHLANENAVLPSHGQQDEPLSLEQLYAHIFLGDVHVDVPNITKIVRIFINSSSTGIYANPIVLTTFNFLLCFFQSFPSLSFHLTSLFFCCSSQLIFCFPFFPS